MTRWFIRVGVNGVDAVRTIRSPKQLANVEARAAILEILAAGLIDSLSGIVPGADEDFLIDNVTLEQSGEIVICFDAMFGFRSESELATQFGVGSSLQSEGRDALPERLGRRLDVLFMERCGTCTTEGPAIADISVPGAFAIDVVYEATLVFPSMDHLFVGMPLLRSSVDWYHSLDKAIRKLSA